MIYILVNREGVRITPPIHSHYQAERLREQLTRVQHRTIEVKTVNNPIPDWGTSTYGAKP